MGVFKLTALMLCGLLVNVMPTAGELYMHIIMYAINELFSYLSAQNACHSNSPACNSRNPNSTLSFFECCVADRLLRQASYGSGTGRSCIRCATLG